MKKINIRSPYYLTSGESPQVPTEQVNCGDTWLTGIDVGNKVFELNTNDVGDIDIVIGGNNVPINFTLDWDGNTATTGYIGLDTYDQQLLDAGVSAGDINTGDPSTKNTTLTINKANATPTLVTLNVLAPLVNDSYSLEFNCPTPSLPTIPCGAGTSYSGGTSYPTVQNVTLGSDTGVVTLNYQAYSVPDRFVVEYQGVVVIDTGYVGDSFYQNQLNSALIALGEPTAPIVGTGQGTATFNKTSATPSVATVKVYAPMSGTGWDFTLGCPQ
jgi:hypothetical protein